MQPVIRPCAQDDTRQSRFGFGRTSNLEKGISKQTKGEQKMGSTGTGKFTDYPGSSGGHPNPGKKGKGGGGGGGGGGSDQCDLAIEDLALEEVGSSEHFTEHSRVPRVGTEVRLRRKLVGSRLAVETVAAREIVGFVPTEYNYLRQCMSRGYEYTGTVVSSSGGSIPQVSVDLSPAA